MAKARFTISDEGKEAIAEIFAEARRKISRPIDVEDVMNKSFRTWPTGDGAYCVGYDLQELRYQLGLDTRPN